MLIKPQGKLTYSHPASNGVPTVQGYSRDWRPDARWSGGVFIEPLKALAPPGDLRPQDMTAFTLAAAYSQAARQVTIPGNPPSLWWEFLDNSVYAASTAVKTYTAALYTPLTGADWQPNLTVRMVRYAPPTGQGVVPQTGINLFASVKVSTSEGVQYLDPAAGTWTDGQVSLLFPLESDVWKEPSLAWSATRADSYIGRDNIFGELKGDTSAKDGKLTAETWAFEYVEEPARFDGGHFLVRKAGDKDWQHFYSECIRLLPGPVRLAMAGCKQAVNVSPITYSATDPVAVTCQPRQAKPLPAAAPAEVPYESDATWAPISTAATGWTVTAATADPAAAQAAVGYRPLVTFTPAALNILATTRPVVWLVGEDHPATIAVPEGLPAAEDTEGDGLLQSISFDADDTWRNAQATAEFVPKSTTAPYPTWTERGQVVLNFGWQTGAGTGLEAADVATLWIAPGGILRWRDGAGNPQLKVQMADLVKVKLEESCIVDMGQAGGMTAGSWFELCGNRIGLPASMIRVDAAIASKTLPTHKTIPSTPNLWPQDGDSWSKHFDEVTKAAGLRWGYDFAAKQLFLDAGTPEYSAGVSTISFTLDADTATEEDVVFRVEAQTQTEGWRNRFKLNYGPEQHKSAWYYAATQAEIVAAGGELWAVGDGEDGDTPADMVKGLNKEHRSQAGLIRWDGPLRRALKPDQFVQITDCAEIGVTTSAVYRITKVHHEGGDFDGDSSIDAVLVYTPPA